MENQQRKLKYLNSDIISDDEEPPKAEDDASDERNEYEEDPDSWTPEEQLEKDYGLTFRSKSSILKNKTMRNQSLNDLERCGFSREFRGHSSGHYLLAHPPLVHFIMQSKRTFYVVNLLFY